MSQLNFPTDLDYLKVCAKIAQEVFGDVMYWWIISNMIEELFADKDATKARVRDLVIGTDR